MSFLAPRGLKAALVIIVALLAAAFLWEKFFVVLYYRLINGSGPEELATQEVSRSEYSIDFSGGASRDNIFFDADAGANDSVLQVDAPHQVKLKNLVASEVSIRSFGTFVDYGSGKLRGMTIFTVPKPVTYAEAVDSIAAYIARLNLTKQFDVSQYAEHLDDVVTEAEHWFFRVKLRYIGFAPMLSCNWELNMKAAPQVKTVACRPFLSFSPLD